MQKRFRALPFYAVVLLAALAARSSKGPGTRVGIVGDCTDNRDFRIGRGVYDITGPAAEVGMMGYAGLFQLTAGIHTRLRSRAFVIESPCNGKRVVLVSADLQGIPHAVKHAVVQRLQAMTWGSVYGDDNVLISGTHAHAGPGGYYYDGLYRLLRTPFNRQSFDVIVDGIFNSIKRAHQSLSAGRIRIASGALLGATVNRSPDAYSLNPSRLAGHDTDTLMTVLRFEDMTGHAVGTINWFAVHGTSMGNSNHLISGDNKGYASYLFEDSMGTRYDAETTFVAAFAQSDEGDASPNLCSKDLRRRDPNRSCQGRERGEGADDFESTRISGERQYHVARMLFDSAREFLIGGVDYRHTYVRMDGVALPDSAGHPRRTAPAAIGLALLTGTPDGHGVPGIPPKGIPCKPADHLFPCEHRAPWDGQGVKPWVPLDKLASLWKCLQQYPLSQVESEEFARSPLQFLVSLFQKPLRCRVRLEGFPLFPDTLPLQIVRIGGLALVAAPFELTTVAGRRLRATVDHALRPAGIRQVVIAGLSNAYASYVTTPEEYDAQYYEGASTLFGKWTLDALQQEFGMLADSLRVGGMVGLGPQPGDTVRQEDTTSLVLPRDATPDSVAFGDIDQGNAASCPTGELVCVTFWGANPNNDLRIQGTFLEVQREDSASWVTVANDWDWETRYQWEKSDKQCPKNALCSHITIEWVIPKGAQPGTYRIRHFGKWKDSKGRLHQYEGTSQEFRVEATAHQPGG